MPRRPRCSICWENWGRSQPAHYLAAQSSNQGKTVVWVKICAVHRMDWNAGGDWPAPIYPLGQAET